MYSNFMMKLMNILPILATNGAGRANGSGGGGSLVGGLANVLAWLGQILVNVVVTVWGWIISLLYFVVKLVLNIMDVLQFFVNKLVGIDIYNNPDWTDIVSFKDSDLIVKLITSETVLKLFRSVLILSSVLLIIFCIISIVKSNFDSAMGADDGKEGQAQKVMKKAVKSIFFCFLTPFLLIVGILGSNVLLASLCNAINGDNNLSLGGIIFTTSAYDANKYRVYAKNGQRVPMYYGDATMVINMGDYQEDADMRNLFYYMAKGDVYIEGITEDTIAKRDAGDYDRWYSDILSMDKNTYAYFGNPFQQTNMTTLQSALGFSVGNIFDGSEVGTSDVATAFESDFQEWYAEYFDSTPLNDIGQGSEIRRKINGWNSNSNWYKNWSIDTLSVDFSASYYTSADNLYFNSTGAYVDILDNTEAYAEYETFATTPLEYYVMADLLDFAIEYNIQLYYVNADNTYIEWSNISINDKEEDNVDVSTYCSEYAVFRYYEGGEPRYYTYYGTVDKAVGENKITQTPDGEKVKYTLNTNGAELDLLSKDAFYVSYYDGTNRLYWSEDGEYRERDGSTYIVCTKDADSGYFVPITQETTKFQSDFLAEEYDGPIVARGIFDKTSMIPQATPQPTAIREQFVDDAGNEVAIVESNDALSLQVVNYDQGNPIENESLSSFIGFTTDDANAISGNLIVEDEAGKDVVNNSIEYLQIGGVGTSIPSLYINRNIKNYRTYKDKDGNDLVSFYDKNGYVMPYGGTNNEATTTMKLEKDPSDPANKVYLYYICGKNGLYKPIVTPKMIDDDSKTLGEFLNSYKNSIGDVNDITLLNEAVVIKYEADLLTFTPITQTNVGGALSPVIGGETLTMLVGAKAVGIAQNGYENSFVTNGSFRLADVYGDGINQSKIMGQDPSNPNATVELGTVDTFNRSVGEYMVDYIEQHTNNKIDMFSARLVNLYIKNGSVYYGGGQKFLSCEDITEEGFYNYSVNYNPISDQMVANVFYDILKNGSGTVTGNFSPYVDLFKQQIIKAFQDSASLNVNDSNVDTVIERSFTSPKQCYDFFCGQPDEGNRIVGEGSDILGTVKSMIYSMLYGQEFLIGLGASVQPLQASYFGYAEDITDKKNVLLSFYSENNKVVESGIEVEARPGEVNTSYNFGAGKKYGARTAGVHIPILVVMKKDSDALVEAVMVNTDSVSSDYSVGYDVYQYDLTYTLKFIQCAGYAFGGTISNIELIPISEEIGDRVLLELRNGSVYCPTIPKIGIGSTGGVLDSALGAMEGVFPSSSYKYVLGLDGIMEIAKGHLSRWFADQDCNPKYLFDLTTISDYNNTYIYFEKGVFSFDLPIDITLHTKGENIFDGGLVFRFAIGVVRTYNVEVKYRLEGGSCILNYNFNENSGIEIGHLFEMRYINPLILLFSTAIVFGMLWNMVWNLITRIYEIGIRFIILPAVLSVDVLSDGKFKAWKDAVIEKVLSAYSVLIMLNLYFALIPSIGEITEGLISWDELPSTFTGLFGAIGVNNGGAIMANIGSKLGGISSGIISSLIAELSETTIITVTGWLNKIIFMMFFLVLTTLVKQGPKILGKFIGTDADIADDTTKKKVGEIRDKAAKVGQTGGKIIKGGVNLAVGVGRKVFSGASNLFGMTSSDRINVRDYNFSSRTTGDLHGSSYVSGSPVTTRSVRGSRYTGAGGRVIEPETGIGGARTEGEREESRRTTTTADVVSALDMAHMDSVVEADTPTERGAGATTVYVATGGDGGAGGTYDDIVEPIRIDESLNSTQLNKMSDNLMDEAATKRGEAEALRKMAKDEFTDVHASEMAEFKGDLAEQEAKLADAQKRRGEAYSLKRKARANGERTDAVDDGSGNIVNAEQIWEDASKEVDEIQAEIEGIKAVIQDYEIRKQAQADYLAEADRLERDADVDDQHAMEYLEAAQDKEREEKEMAAAITRAEFEKFKSETEAKLNEKANQEDFDVLLDETTRIESETVDNIKQIKEDSDAMFDLTTDLETTVFDGLDAVQQNAFDAVDTKADAELTREALDEKADAEAVERFAQDASKAINKAGRFKFGRRGRNNDDDDDDPDDDPRGGGSGRPSNGGSNSDVTTTTAHNINNDDGATNVNEHNSSYTQNAVNNDAGQSVTNNDAGQSVTNNDAGQSDTNNAIPEESYTTERANEHVKFANSRFAQVATVAGMGARVIGHKISESKLVGGIKAGVKYVTAPVVKGVEYVKTGVTTAGHKIADTASAAGHKVVDTVSAAGHKVADTVSAAGHKVAGVASAAGHKVAGVASAAGHKVAGVASAAGHKVADVAKTGAQYVSKPFVTTASWVNKNVTTAVKFVGGKVDSVATRAKKTYHTAQAKTLGSVIEASNPAILQDEKLLTEREAKLQQAQGELSRLAQERQKYAQQIADADGRVPRGVIKERDKIEKAYQKAQEAVQVAERERDKISDRLQREREVMQSMQQRRDTSVGVAGQMSDIIDGERIGRAREKAELRREAELTKEAERQIHERERQERAEERKIVRDAYVDYAVDGVKTFGHSVADGVKTGASAVASGAQAVGHKVADTAKAGVHAVVTGAQVVSTKVQKAYQGVKAGAFDAAVDVGETLIYQDEALLTESEEQLRQAEEDFEKAKTAYFDLPAERMTQEEINAERAQLGEQLTTHDEHSRQLFAMNARITELSEATETVKKMKGIQAELEKRKKDKASFDDQFQMATEQIRVIASIPAGERTAESKAKLDELSRHTDEIMAQIQTSGVEISRLQHQLDSLPPIPEGIDPERVKAEFFKAVKERDKYERQVSKTSDPQVTARIQALDEAQAILDARDEVERAYEDAMDARFEAEANRNRVLNRLERERELVRDFEAMRDSSEDKADGLDKRLSELSKKKKK